MMQELLENRKFAAVFVLLLVTSVAFLAAIVHFYPVLALDIRVTRMLQSTGGPAFARVMNIVSVFGNSWIPYLVVGLTAAISLAFSYAREAVFVLLTSVSSVANFLMKVLINRPRPHSPLVMVHDKVSGPSFPSGHVVQYVVFYGFLLVFVLTRKEIPLLVRVSIGSISLCLIFSVGASRVYLGAHWATDVIAGYLTGLATLFILLHFYFRKPRTESFNKHI